MSSSARLAGTTRFLQRPTLYKAYPSLLWNARAGPSASSGTSSNVLSPFVRTFSLSASQFDSDKALPRQIKKKDDDDEPPNQMEHQVPQPVFSLPGGLTFPFTRSPLADAALTTIVGLIMVLVGGVAYVSWYKKRVLDKIEVAFAKGYDPALELTKHIKIGRGVDDLKEGISPEVLNLRHKEQAVVDSIMQGKEPGHYFLLTGPKGTGKASMILEAMRTIDADGVSYAECHPDLEVFRLRFGKALNYEYNEDSQTGLFQRRDPREGGAALDIERALNKLEKVALRCHRKTGRPLVMIFNNVHLLPKNDEGKNMLLQLQQRAEVWCESGILTMVFTTDDYWPYQVLRKTQHRMQVLGIYDLDHHESYCALQRMRKAITHNVEESDEKLHDIVRMTGGRLSFLARVSRAPDMEEGSKVIVRHEKVWLQSQIGLIPDLDDDVMDEQKWSSCSWLLLQAFVKMQQEAEKEHGAAIAKGETVPELGLPSIPYWQCRVIMTRPDFLEELDRLNIITIDTNLDVRPDSMALLRAAREVVEEPDFQGVLDSVRKRVDDIESLHRTRELTFKGLEGGDVVRLMMDKNGKRKLFGWW